MSKPNGENTKDNKNTKTILLFLVIIALLVCVIVLLLNRPEQTVVKATPVPNVLVGVSQDDIDALLKKQKEDADKGNFIVALPKDVVFKDGKSEGNIMASNIKENIYPFTVEYFLEDNTSVLKTGLIAPGYVVEKQALDVELPKGTYPISMVYTTFDENGEEVGRIGLTTTFIVQN